MSILLRKSIQTIKNQGASAFAKKAMGYLEAKLEPAKILLYPYARLRIKRFNKTLPSIKESMNFAFYDAGRLIRPSQVKSEIEALLNVVQKTQPKRILEIGTSRGGTVFLFAQTAPQAQIISIDLPGGTFGGGYPKWKIPLYQSFMRPNQKLHLLRANSHHTETLQRVRSLLLGNPVDFLFIDGDHAYEGVKKDFELYSPLVKKGGTIAFHDIAVHPPESGCTVSVFWDEVKQGKHFQEIIEDQNQKWAGIGILYL